MPRALFARRTVALGTHPAPSQGPDGAVPSGRVRGGHGMSGRDEFDDDRDQQQDREAAGDRCKGDDSSLPFGPGYLENLLALEDAPVKAGSLDLLVPHLSDRSPEPRLLGPRDVWFQRDRTPVPLDDLDEDGARRLLDEIEDLAGDLHQVAARDEALTTSSGTRRAMASAGVPTIVELDPRAWLESTVLVRALRDRCW